MRKVSIILLSILISAEAIANYDVTIIMKTLHVKNIAGLGDNPDVKVEIKLLRPEPEYWGGKTYLKWATPVAKDQVVCNHPHEGSKFQCTHADPILIVWDIWDIDWEPFNLWPDYMDGGREELNLGDPCTVVSRQGTYTDIELVILQKESACGRDVTTVVRDLKVVVNPNTLSTVTLNLHINEVNIPSLVTLYEEIPNGFTFENANPAPTSVTPVTDDAGLNLTMVRWDFVSPAGGLSTITYNVTTPPTADQMFAGIFGAQIDVDGEVIYPSANDIRVERPIPTISQWGLIIMVISLLAAGAIVIIRCRRVAA